MVLNIFIRPINGYFPTPDIAYFLSFFQIQHPTLGQKFGWHATFTTQYSKLSFSNSTFRKKSQLDTWHSYPPSLVTRIKPYCFPTVFKRLISVGFQLLISKYRNPTEITLEKTFIQQFKNPTFHTENQPFLNVGNTFFNGCCVTRVYGP